MNRTPYIISDENLSLLSLHLGGPSHWAHIADDVFYANNDQCFESFLADGFILIAVHFGIVCLVLYFWHVCTPTLLQPHNSLLLHFVVLF